MVGQLRLARAVSVHHADLDAVVDQLTTFIASDGALIIYPDPARFWEVSIVELPELLQFIRDGSDANPVWSLDGQIMFHYETRGIFQLCIMNADGTGVTQMTSLPTSSFFPEWGRGT
jgi:hypothetical protein